MRGSLRRIVCPHCTAVLHIRKRGAAHRAKRLAWHMRQEHPEMVVAIECAVVGIAQVWAA